MNNDNTVSQIQSFVQSKGLNPTPSSVTPATNDWHSLIKAPANTNPPSQSHNSNPTSFVSDTVKNTANDEVNGASKFLTEAGKNDNSTSANPIIRTGENALAATASGIGTIFSPITNAVKAASDNFAANAKDPTNQGQPLYNNPIVGKILDFFSGANGKLNDFATAHPEAARNLSNALTIGLTVAGGKTGVADTSVGSAEGIKSGISDIAQGAKETAQNAIEGTKNVASTASDITKNAAGKVKEGFVPTPTPAEATGQIIQGAPEDVASSQRALSNIDTRGVKTYADLQQRINSEIKPLAQKVDSILSENKTGNSIKSYEQSIGTGKSAVKVNYVRQAIDDLNNFYTKTNDAKGLAAMKQLENNAKIKGLNLKQVNDLARLHGQTINAFNANGEAASGLTKQAAENTRSGLKTIARQGLGGKEAQALDAKLTDLYNTKALVDKQATKVNSLAQKTPKQGVIPRTVGNVVKTGIKTADLLTGSPLKAIGKEIGLGGNQSSMSALEIEKNLAKNLRVLRGK